MNTTAEFVERDCINCSSAELRTLASGRFDESPLREFIAADPYGERPELFVRGQRWNYVQCEKCGTAFHRRVLSPKWTAYLHEKWVTKEAIEEFEKNDQSPDSIFRKTQEEVGFALQIEFLTRPIRDGAIRLLDFGCGNGEFLSVCLAFGFDACGVDRSIARKDMSAVHIFSDFKEVENKQFHAITLFEVLEHLDDPLPILRKLRGLMPVGGILVLTTPDCTGVTGIKTLTDYRLINPLSHINGFTPITLRSMADRAGFRPTRAPTPYVSVDFSRVTKRFVRMILSPVLGSTTRQFFTAN